MSVVSALPASRCAPAPASPEGVLGVPRGAVVLVAGQPGAGKTTFLRRVVRDADVPVLDSDDVRRALVRRLGPLGGSPLLRPLVHLGHALRVAGAVRGPGTVVVHETGTRPLVRRALAALAGGPARPTVLVLLDVAPEEAREGQRARARRPVRDARMRRHVGAWRALLERLRADPDALAAEGFGAVVVLDRATADRVGALRLG